MNGEIHEPKFLKIQWGRWTSARILSAGWQSVEIEYTAFDKDGTPLRAKLRPSLIGEMLIPQSGITIGSKSSPDLTHAVSSNRVTPCLCFADEIYGSPGHYLSVARANALDDFRNLIPGQELNFPPVRAGQDPGRNMIDPPFL